MNPPAPGFVDFFAGSGMVTQGAKHTYVRVWSYGNVAEAGLVFGGFDGSEEFTREHVFRENSVAA